LWSGQVPGVYKRLDIGEGCKDRGRSASQNGISRRYATDNIICLMIIRYTQKGKKKNKEQKINRHKMPEKQTERKKPPRKKSPKKNKRGIPRKESPLCALGLRLA
jgi:hypothetical protein